MTIHKEGFSTIFVVGVFLALLNFGVNYFVGNIEFISNLLMIASIIIFVIVVNFFRSPNRKPVQMENAIIAPADGKVVVIEEVEEPEYFNGKCLQVSIFMSPFNVHVNWFPMKGIIRYYRHHSGRFMAAYLPKSSTENERSTVVIEDDKNRKILVRQVAGALARRIVTYANEESGIDQGDEMGFIKFGSRLDLYLPLDTQIDVKIDQKVSGRQTVVGWLK